MGADKHLMKILNKTFPCKTNYKLRMGPQNKWILIAVAVSNKYTEHSRDRNIWWSQICIYFIHFYIEYSFHAKCDAYFDSEYFYRKPTYFIHFLIPLVAQNEVDWKSAQCGMCDGSSCLSDRFVARRLRFASTQGSHIPQSGRQAWERVTSLWNFYCISGLLSCLAPLSHSSRSRVPAEGARS